MGKVVRGPLSTAKRAKGGKKNAGVGVDFKRIKRKVGKKLKKAQNETVTTFKSASVHIPSQQAMEDEKAGGAATNSHNLSLPELLVQSGHYSDKTRKAALAGLADLLLRHPQELERHAGNAGQLLTKLAERAGDGDSGVRQALRSLMRERVMPLLNPGAVRPFMPVVMAHVSSAMTNLCMEVRLDALSFLDIFMDFVPELVSGIEPGSSSLSPLAAAGGVTASRGGFLSPCLQHFCDLLGQGHRGRSIKSQSIASLLKIIQSLNSFLKRAFGGEALSVEASGVMAESLPQASEDGHAPKKKKKLPASSSSSIASDAQAAKARGTDLVPTVLMHERTEWPPRPSMPLFSSLAPLWSPHRNQNDPLPPSQPQPQQPQQRASLIQQGKKRQQPGVATPLASDSAAPSPLARSDPRSLAMRLVSILLSQCWNECSASVSSSNQTVPDLQQLQALSGILSATSGLVTRLILTHDGWDVSSNEGGGGGGGNAGALTWLADLALPRVTPCFPATVPAVKPNQAISESLVAYNIQCSQLLAMILPAAASSSLQAGPSAPLLSPSAASRGNEMPHNVRPSIPAWVQVLVHYFIGVMERSDLVPARSGSLLSETSSLAAGTATNAAHLSALKGIEVALFTPSNAVASDWVDRISAAIEVLAARVSSRSPVKVACLRLQHRLMEASRRGLFHLDGAKLAGWLSPLPKLVWELSLVIESCSETIEVALRMMLDAARFPYPHSCSSSSADKCASPSLAISSMQQQLAPLFCVFMPQQDPKAKTSSGSASAAYHPSCVKCRDAELEAVAKVEAARSGTSLGMPSIIPGPYSKLPTYLQSLIADLIYHIDLNEPMLLKAISAAAIEAHVLPDHSAASRLVEAALAPRALPISPTTGGQDGEELDDSLGMQASLAVTLLFAPPRPSPSAAPSTWDAIEAVWQRHKALVDRVCLSLAQSSPHICLADKVKCLAEAMMPAICGAVLAGGIEGLVASRQSYGLIRLCTFISEEEAKSKEEGGEQGEKGKPSALEAKEGWIVSEVLAVLPRACLSFYSERTRTPPPLPPSASFLQQAARSSLTESNAAEAGEAVTCLIKSCPGLLPLLIQEAADETRQKGHSDACSLHACCSSVDLLQRIMQCKALRQLILDHAGRIGTDIRILLSHARARVKDNRQQQSKCGSESTSRSAEEVNEMLTRLEQTTIDLGI